MTSPFVGGAPSAFINDGQSEKAYIKEQFNVHPACRVIWRPLLIEERAMVLARLEKCGDDQAKKNREMAAAMAPQITSWDLKNGPEDVEITAKNILRLKFQLFDRLTGIVLWGYDGGDPDPDEKKGYEQKREADEIELESALTGRAIVDVREERKTKN